LKERVQEEERGSGFVEDGEREAAAVRRPPCSLVDI
jgi:hypothetical protein